MFKPFLREVKILANLRQPTNIIVLIVSLMIASWGKLVRTGTAMAGLLEVAEAQTLCQIPPQVVLLPIPTKGIR